ncbi:hypothetical protein I7I50_05263 [Histoplasma capsulatum G186AR]|uniref:Uncharacterized protein n=1 Tax=Ajellomyces capsulatus TaxID=5037 RepID=A0A8H8D9X2_AJECA|nr:hypothetical protein I7I52_03522 [Histoplasma capsulatum]QSS75957.1 hypothetical protein I7I50_05263 [Histoplasma capsulatum G186AR]
MILFCLAGEPNSNDRIGPRVVPRRLLENGCSSSRSTVTPYNSVDSCLVAAPKWNISEHGKFAFRHILHSTAVFFLSKEGRKNVEISTHAVNYLHLRMVNVANRLFRASRIVRTNAVVCYYWKC